MNRKEIKTMIRAYDEHGNIARCANCKYYRHRGYCVNTRNTNRGSGDEYSFSIDFVGINEPRLTKEQCDNWVCGDFELKGIDKYPYK